MKHYFSLLLCMAAILIFLCSCKNNESPPADSTALETTTAVTETSASTEDTDPITTSPYYYDTMVVIRAWADENGNVFDLQDNGTYIRLGYTYSYKIELGNISYFNYYGTLIGTDAYRLFDMNGKTYLRIDAYDAADNKAGTYILTKYVKK